MELIIGLAVIAALAVLVIVLFNRLVALRQNRANAFADIDVQLKQRYDLVPQLVETVKGYAAHEKSVLENVTAARGGVAATRTGEGRIAAEQRLSGALVNLVAVAENYPQLKADANFQNLMNELSDIENKIAAARRYFNNATSEYNTSLQQFPANLIAAPLGFRTEPFYEDQNTARVALETAPAVKF